MKRILATAILLAASSASPALAADAVLVMNDVLLSSVRAAGTAPPRASRQMAMLNTAMYDAVNGITGGHEPYLHVVEGPKNAYPAAAAAASARTVLSTLYPADSGRISAAYDGVLADLPPSRNRQRGIAYGESVAATVLAARADDGSDDVVTYTPSGLVGRWQPTPPAYAPPAFPQWPGVEPWGLVDAAQFRPEGPPDLTSPAYADNYNEVKELGAIASVVRSDEQALIARFWADGAGTATPPGHWLVIAEDVSLQLGLSLEDNAHLFGLLGIALADAAIAAWDAKYEYDHHRPVTAIQIDAALDGNAGTEADPSWTPFIPTPPFPEYVSGHSTFSGAAARVLARFVGTDFIVFTTVAEEPAVIGEERSFSSFSQAAEEAGKSRIYGGIHFEHGNRAGLELGARIGDWVTDTLLLPVDSTAAGL